MKPPRMGHPREPVNIEGKWYVELRSYGIEHGIGDGHSLMEANRLFQGRTDLICLEIGVAVGQNANNIYKTLNPELLVLVDPWQVTGDSLEFHDNHWAETYYRVQDKKNVIVIKTTSVQASEILNLTFDYVYIDGDHTNVMRDILAWYPKMNPRGIFAGHDYNYDNIKKDVHDFFGSKVNTSPYHPHGGMDWWVYT